jgi:hypothetical protein
MKKLLYLLCGVLFTTLTLYGQDITAEQKILFDNYPVVHDMKRDYTTRERTSTIYRFVKGEAKYRRAYDYGVQKTCIHEFTIERDNKRYGVFYAESYAPVFYTATYSKEQKRWVKSKKIECKLEDLPYNMRHVIRIDQGTLSAWR